MTKNDNPPSPYPATKAIASKVAIRQSNQRKIAITAIVLFAIVVGVAGLLLSNRPNVDVAAVSYRLGQVVSFFLIATILSLGLTYFGKKIWTWGFAVFLYVALLIPIFKLGS